MSFWTPANRLRTAALASVAGAAIFFSPMIISFNSSAPKIDSSKPLKPEAIRRGAFNNSGSRDLGPDPNWVNGRWQPTSDFKQKAPSSDETTEHQNN